MGVDRAYAGYTQRTRAGAACAGLGPEPTHLQAGLGGGRRLVHGTRLRLGCRLHGRPHGCLLRRRRLASHSLLRRGDGRLHRRGGFVGQLTQLGCAIGGEGGGGDERLL